MLHLSGTPPLPVRSLYPGGPRISRSYWMEVSMNSKLISAFGASALMVCAMQALAQITFYEGEGFRGRAFTADRPVANLEGYGFNDRASSVIVDSGRWEVCEFPRFHGRCVMLRRGSYDSLEGMGLDNRISSVRPVERVARNYYEPEPLPAPTYEYRPRPSERIYQAPVTSVRAVMGPPSERCWVERQQVVEPASGPNVPGAVVGAIVGGILGHQVGRGTGRDVATAGGAVGGAVVGSNVARGSGGVYDRDIRRCETVAGGPPEYWDVTYVF